MEIRTGFLDTKVARRIFLLFLACALVPILAAGAVGYLHVQSQLMQQSRERLRGTAKSIGMVAFQRISFLETALETVVAGIRTGEADQGIAVRLATTGDSTSRPRFLGLLLRRDGAPVRSWEAAPDAPSDLSAGQREHLREAHTLVVLRGEGTEGTDRPRILLGRALRPPDLEAGVLWGTAEVSTLWEDQGLPRSTALCVLGTDGAPIRCPHGPSSGLRKAVAPTAGLENSDDVLWKMGGEEYLAGVWSLFLSGRYAADPWTVIVSRPVAVVAGPLRDFRRSFVLVLVLAVLVVLYASNVQIRRSLVPLRKLRDGTRRVARGDLDTPVSVESDDEFEELADSFNEMTREVSRLLRDLDELAWGALLALARTIDAKSPWTSGHSERVARLSVALGRELDLAAEELGKVARGTLIHDLGKIGIPARILDRPGPLTEEEWVEMKKHPVVGAQILEPISRYEDIIPIVRHHHERWDGDGYPDGLEGSEIHPLARLVAVADAFDAMTSDRPYRDGLPVERALKIIRREAGAHFDPEMARAFVALVEREGPEVGSVSAASLEELAASDAVSG